MNKPTNPQVGTKYRLNSDGVLYKKDDVFILKEDDGENNPYFTDKNGKECCMFWSNLEPLEKTFETLEVGDVVEDRDGELTVLGRCGKIVFTSSINNDDSTCYIYTEKELKNKGYTIKQPPVTKEIKELTLDEIAEKFGLPVEQIRIKKEDK